MKTAQTPKRSLTVNQGVKGALAIFLLATALGCQRMKFGNEQAPATESMPSDTKKPLSQFKQLEENQKGITESVESIRMDQLTIGTKVAGAQRQLANQVAENAQAIQQGQADLKTTVQDINLQFAQQFQDLAGRQQRLERVIEAIHANGQTLCKSHEQLTTQLTELQQAFLYCQEQLGLMSEKMVALDASITTMQANLGERKSALTDDIRGLTQHLSSKQAIEQDMGQQLTTLRGIVTEVQALHGRLLAMLKSDDKTAKVQDSSPIRVVEPEVQEDGQISLSRQIDAPTKPGIDGFRRP